MNGRCFGVVARALTGVGILVAGLSGAVIAPPSASATSLVTLSGTVTFGGTPAAGSGVSFGGVSATVDTSGHYALHPFAGTSGTLVVNAGVVQGSVPVTVGTADQSEDVTFPTSPATAIAHVVDGDGNALAGLPLHASVITTPSEVASGATTDGAPLTWNFSGAYPGAAQATCTTDATGTCSLPTLLHLTGSVTATVSKPYGNDTSYPATFSTTVTGAAESDPAVSTIVVDWTHSLVTVSGTVSIGGAPTAGATVTYAGLTSTTDANGHYALHPFAGTSGTLTVNSGPYNSNQSLSVGTTDSTVDIDIPSAGTQINLTGVVSLGGTIPLQYMTVRLGGLSATTDVNGHYVLHPFAGTVGTLQISGGPYRAAAPITVGGVDQIDDVSIPTAPITATVHVLDGDGNPIANQPVMGSLLDSTSPVTGLTSDGSPVTWSIVGYDTPQLLCTTDGSGTCSFASLTNLEGRVTATVSNPYGNDHSYPSTFTASAATLSSPETTEGTLVVDWVHTIVSLSGTVTINGNPAANATVRYGALSTTSDASGHYTLHPFANDSETLDVTAGLIHGSEPVLLGDHDQTADIDVPFSGTLVNLTGTVLIGTAPDAGATVSFGGVSTTIDSSGHYALQVYPGTSGALTTNGLFYSSATISVGSTDQVEDITIPADPTTATVYAVDGSGHGLPGLQVHLAVSSSPSPVKGTTSTGEPVTWGVNIGPGSLDLNCVTGGDGSCSFQGVTNITGTLSASRQLVPGDSSYPTLYASYTGTAPVDGSPVTLAFPNVAFVPSAGSVAGSVLVTTQGSTSIGQSSAATVPSSLLPSGATAPVGAIRYTVHSVPVGGSLDVFVQLPPGTNPTAVDKIVNGALVDLSSQASISGDTITLHLTDGGPGDADGLANGTIVDPVVPITGAAAPTITAQPLNQVATAGHAVTFSAAATGAPTPAVQWESSSDGGATFTPIAGAMSRTYTFTPSAGDAGAQFHAVFSNSEGSATTAAATLSLKTTTSVALSASVAVPVFGQATRLTALVTSPLTGKAKVGAGTVTFLDGGTPIGTALVTLGKATFTIASLATGPHAISAVYSGSGAIAPGNSSGFSLTVVRATTATTLSCPTKAKLHAVLTCKVKVATRSPGKGIPAGTVVVYDGTHLVAVVTLDAAGVGAWSTTTLAAGTHSLVAVYVPDANHLASTSAVRSVAII